MKRTTDLMTRVDGWRFGDTLSACEGYGGVNLSLEGFGGVKVSREGYGGV